MLSKNGCRSSVYTIMAVCTHRCTVVINTVDHETYVILDHTDADIIWALDTSQVFHRQFFL